MSSDSPELTQVSAYWLKKTSLSKPLFSLVRGCFGVFCLLSAAPLSRICLGGRTTAWTSP